MQNDRLFDLPPIVLTTDITGPAAAGCWVRVGEASVVDGLVRRTGRHLRARRARPAMVKMTPEIFVSERCSLKKISAIGISMIAANPFTNEPDH